MRQRYTEEKPEAMSTLICSVEQALAVAARDTATPASGRAEPRRAEEVPPGARHFLREPLRETDGDNAA